ncbi:MULTISPECIES: lipid-A-disaccharide synthase [unclassified Oleiphilus]|uniref:lipid-A-disaccharide synthase n=1 Tax=unclassified Oleiphilus TaxID=2631174 RepID=UPI0009EEB0C0|nr:MULTISPECIES: lipid-A-disaccharide synthase [unclassified Oleiphilus]
MKGSAEEHQSVQEQLSDNVVSERPVTIAMVAGEASGDILGAGLIKSLLKRYPNARFEGIGGPLMLAEGFNSHVPMERLSVMGLVEVLGRIFELIGIRRRLKQHFLKSRPDAFIGIDAPDFNIGLELALRKKGLKTGHYVSPSVWAWRQKRIFKIARAVDLMLTLFPFEAKFYKAHDVAVRFVGHPLADSIPEHSDKSSAREALGLDQNAKLVALLPGSRAGEISYIGKSFLDTACWLYERDPNIKFVLPYVNEARKEQILSLLDDCEVNLPLTLISGRSREVMAASDVIVLASGTATLEAMLVNRPMVVSYRVSKITHYIMKRLLKAPFISLPNLLAGRELVPELVQDDAQPELIGKQVMERFLPSKATETQESFSELHKSLKLNASEQAADAVVKLIESGK